MPLTVNPVDPPDLGLLPTFRRLLRLWWGQRRLGFLGLAFAFLYTVISTLIPILLSQAINNSIVSHKKPLWPYLLAIVVLALIRFGVNFTRRFATARIGVRIEAQMRQMLYSAYLRYPRAFYDRHATGQVLSRATNDLYPIRYFIGWGLVQGMQSVMMITATGIVLVVVNPKLALFTAVAMPPITVLALRFARRVSPISRAGAGAEGRRDGGGGRGRRRDRDGAGVRPRGRRARAVRRPRRARCATPCCGRPASRRGTCRGCTTCRRSPSRRSSTSAARR